MFICSSVSSPCPSTFFWKISNIDLRAENCQETVFYLKHDGWEWCSQLRLPLIKYLTHYLWPGFLCMTEGLPSDTMLKTILWQFLFCNVWKRGFCGTVCPWYPWRICTQTLCGDGYLSIMESVMRALETSQTQARIAFQSHLGDCSETLESPDLHTAFLGLRQHPRKEFLVFSQNQKCLSEAWRGHVCFIILGCDQKTLLLMLQVIQQHLTEVMLKEGILCSYWYKVSPLLGSPYTMALQYST